MRVINQEELKKIKESIQAQGKMGSRKMVIPVLLAIIKANKGKAVEVGVADVAPHFVDGFTEGLLMDVAEQAKINYILPTPTMLKREIKGKLTEVPRFMTAVLEC